MNFHELEHEANEVKASFEAAIERCSHIIDLEAIQHRLEILQDFAEELEEMLEQKKEEFENE